MLFALITEAGKLFSVHIIYIYIYIYILSGHAITLCVVLNDIWPYFSKGNFQQNTQMSRTVALLFHTQTSNLPHLKRITV